jgi:SWIM zinc finger
VLAGDVALLTDGTAKVSSQSNDTTVYHIVNGECSCKDFAKAPHNLCKHRLSAAIVRRAQAVLTAKGDTNGHAAADPAPLPEAPTVPLPEAPVSITLKATLHGHEVMVTLRGVDFASVKAQVEDASHWLQSQRSQGTDDTPQCSRHGAMKPSIKGKGFYCPHKLADGSWCKGK